MPSFITPVRDAIKTISEDSRGRKRIPVLQGFCLPKGIAPLLPIFLQGLLSGSNDIRELAALGLGDIIELTSVEALKPFVITITGPLIRIVGDRFEWQVKAAILHTLRLVF